jgi:hypothetical protein
MKREQNMERIQITVNGRKALVNPEHAPLFYRKSKLVQRALSLNAQLKLTPQDPTLEGEIRSTMSGIIRINATMKREGAVCHFV